MSTTSALPLHAAPGPRSGAAAPGRVHRPPAPRPGPVTGRFRGDLTTGTWWWSPELHDLLGAPAGTAPTTVQLLLSHVHADDRTGLQEALAVAGTSGTAFAREQRVHRADGTALTLLVVCEPEVDPAGVVLALPGLVVDVTAGRPAGEDDVVRDLQTEVEQLRSAMASRAAIEQAKGVLMVLMSCGDQVAFDLLAHISSHTHRKVRDVAVLIIDSASGRNPLPDDVREILHDASPPPSPS